MDHPMAVGAKQHEIGQLGFRADGQLRDRAGMVAFNEPLSSVPVGRLEVEATRFTV